jgi:transcriptional regulator with XRE-family HTH domain
MVWFVTLKKFRRDKGLTLAVLAKRIGVSAAAVSRYERGIRVPRYKTMLKIREVTNDNVGLDDWAFPRHS